MTTATVDRRRKAGGISLDRAELQKAMSIAAKAVPTRTPNPIMHSVLFRDGFLIATDGDLRIDCRIDWDGHSPLVLPHARLQAILRACDGDAVSFRPEKNTCVVSIGRGEWRLPTADPDEFPAWEAKRPQPLPVFPSDELSRAIRHVIYAVDAAPGRHTLSGVLLEVSRNEETTCLVGTDGRRLSVATMRLPATRDVDDSHILLPTRAVAVLDEIAGLYGDEGSAVDMSASVGEFIAVFERHRVVARLLNGDFPKWRKVFPRGRTTEDHVVNIHGLMTATRAAAVVTSEQSKGVDFTFTPTEIVLQAKSAEYGSSKIECAVETAGQLGTVRLNPAFLTDVLFALGKLDGEPTVRISIDGENAVVLSYGEENEYRSVILPMERGVQA